MALRGDILHNLADALTAVPLGIAFLVGRRTANRRYTYGFGRAEDLASIIIVLIIAASAVVAGTRRSAGYRIHSDRLDRAWRQLPIAAGRR